MLYRLYGGGPAGVGPGSAMLNSGPVRFVLCEQLVAVEDRE